MNANGSPGAVKTMLFASDLDNTLIHSWRHFRPGDVCVERIEGRPQGYMRPGAVGLLREVCRHSVFVPVTSRSSAQFGRIEFPDGCAPDCALVAQGALLIRDGVPDAEWQKRTDTLIRPWLTELERVRLWVASQPSFGGCVQRVVDGAYLFIGCGIPGEAEARAEELAGMTGLRVERSGRKVYVLPPGLDKGSALTALRQRWPHMKAIAAGDSALDAGLLLAADRMLLPAPRPGAEAPLPEAELARLLACGRAAVCPTGGDFSEFVLKTCLAHVQEEE